MKKDLREIFSNIKVQRATKTNTIKKQIQAKLEIVNFDKIMQDLTQKRSEDIFLFIRGHSELERFDATELTDESFKVFLQVVRDERVLFSGAFNKFGIKVARWQ
ncbi:MAG: hypothetical protein Q9M40_05545 [Sulfurimonas sp.]|nr:hypothetical protein [Sulfurimonas sp.]